MYRFARAFWPVFAWMAVVFLMSTDVGSAAHTSRYLDPFLRWLVPGISAEGVENIHFLVRKAGHVIEYAILALLVLRALRVVKAIPSSRWSVRLGAIALVVSVAYAATDEVHQLYVGSRGGSFWDVLIDASGAILGLLLAYVWHRRRARRPEAPVSGCAEVLERNA